MIRFLFGAFKDDEFGAKCSVASNVGFYQDRRFDLIGSFCDRTLVCGYVGPFSYS